MVSNTETHHSIKVVAKKTGLTQHVIRVWEKRYGAVTPERTGTNRRLYSTEQIERLQLLRESIEAGHSIGNIAKLPTDTLRGLAAAAPQPTPHAAPDTSPARALAEECIAAIRGLDSGRLEGALNRSLVLLGHQGLLQQVVAPVTHQVGDLWRQGVITAAHEHFATAVLRTFLGARMPAYAPSASSPCLVVGTPAGQLHELGALIVMAAAAQMGWRVTYLGSSLPAAEIAGAALQNQAKAVALSIVYPDDDPALPGELANLRRFLPPHVQILAGGRAANSYAAALREVKAIHPTSLLELSQVLEDLRRPAPLRG